MKEAIEKIEEINRILKLNGWDKWMVTEPLAELKSLLQSKARYTQKDLCNAYKQGHSDGLLNKPVLDEFDKCNSRPQQTEQIDQGGVEALEQSAYELFEDLTENSSITDRGTIEQLVNHVLQKSRPESKGGGGFEDD